jgi:hypothetical protein
METKNNKKNRKRKKEEKQRKEKKKKKSKRNYQQLLPTAKNRTGILQVKVAGQLLYHDFSPCTCANSFKMTLIH